MSRTYTERHEGFRVGTGTPGDPLIVWLTDRPNPIYHAGWIAGIELACRQVCSMVNRHFIYIRAINHNRTSAGQPGNYVLTDSHMTVFMSPQKVPERRNSKNQPEYEPKDFEFAGHVFTLDDPSTGYPIGMSRAVERPITGPQGIPNPELWNIRSGQKVPLPMW